MNSLRKQNGITSAEKDPLAIEDDDDDEVKLSTMIKKKNIKKAEKILLQNKDNVVFKKLMNKKFIITPKEIMKKLKMSNINELKKKTKPCRVNIKKINLKNKLLELNGKHKLSSKIGKSRKFVVDQQKQKQKLKSLNNTIPQLKSQKSPLTKSKIFIKLPIGNVAKKNVTLKSSRNKTNSNTGNKKTNKSSNKSGNGASSLSQINAPQSQKKINKLGKTYLKQKFGPRVFLCHVKIQYISKDDQKKSRSKRKKSENQKSVSFRDDVLVIPALISRSSSLSPFQLDEKQLPSTSSSTVIMGNSSTPIIKKKVLEESIAESELNKKKRKRSIIDDDSCEEIKENDKKNSSTKSVELCKQLPKKRSKTLIDSDDENDDVLEESIAERELNKKKRKHSIIDDDSCEEIKENEKKNSSTKSVELCKHLPKKRARILIDSDDDSKTESNGTNDKLYIKKNAIKNKINGGKTRKSLEIDETDHFNMENNSKRSRNKRRISDSSSIREISPSTKTPTKAERKMISGEIKKNGISSPDDVNILENDCATQNHRLSSSSERNFLLKTPTKAQKKMVVRRDSLEIMANKKSRKSSSDDRFQNHKEKTQDNEKTIENTEKILQNFESFHPEVVENGKNGENSENAITDVSHSGIDKPSQTSDIHGRKSYKCQSVLFQSSDDKITDKGNLLEVEKQNEPTINLDVKIGNNDEIDLQITSGNTDKEDTDILKSNFLTSDKTDEFDLIKSLPDEDLVNTSGVLLTDDEDDKNSSISIDNKNKQKMLTPINEDESSYDSIFGAFNKQKPPENDLTTTEAFEDIFDVVKNSDLPKSSRLHENTNNESINNQPPSSQLKLSENSNFDLELDNVLTSSLGNKSSDDDDFADAEDFMAAQTTIKATTTATTTTSSNQLNVIVSSDIPTTLIGGTISMTT